MSQGDSLALAFGATMALILASRSVRSLSFSLKAKVAMALAWVLLILAAASIASRGWF